MGIDFDTELTDLAAEILRDAAQVYNMSDVDTWVFSHNPVLTAWNSGMFSGLEMTSSFHAVTGSFQAVGQHTASASEATLKQLFRLPRKLPGVRLPSDEQLVAIARSAPIMMYLEALAEWLGPHGRLVTDDDLLHEADEVDAARWLRVSKDYIPFLWEYALVSGWLDVRNDLDGQRRSAVLGSTARRWADGDISGTLHVWAVVFASVLTTTLEVAADQAPEASRSLNFQGQGVALVIMMFLARRTGLTKGDAADIVRSGAVGDVPTKRARKAWQAWTRRFGDPAGWLLSELACLHAIALPLGQEDVITLIPLAQWALRQQFRVDKINIPVIPTSGQLSVADLIELADGVRDDEFEAEFRYWLDQRDPRKAAQDLLMYAGSASAQGRLTAVRLVRRLGQAAIAPWLEAMQWPQLRGYARVALSMMSSGILASDYSPGAKFVPDDMNWMAADLLALRGDSGDSDCDQITALFDDVVPSGERPWVIDVMASSHNEDVVGLLELVSRYHPDRRLAKRARMAAHSAARNRSIAGHRRVGFQGPRR